MAGGSLQYLKWLSTQLILENQFLRAGDLVTPGSPVQLISVASGNHIKVNIANVNVRASTGGR